MRIVATFPTLAEASFAQSLLMGDGLAAELQNVEASVNLVGGPPAFQVVVPDADFERARAAVEVLTPEAAPAAPAPPETLLAAIARGIGIRRDGR
jgi:hypothetical protein